MTPSFIKKWHGRVYNNKTKISDLPTVQCLPMKLLLRELNVKHVDLWVLDVEGAEESVLLVPRQYIIPKLFLISQFFHPRARTSKLFILALWRWSAMSTTSEKMTEKWIFCETMVLFVMQLIAIACAKTRISFLQKLLLKVA